MSGDHASDGPMWRVVDGAVCIAAGLILGMLLAVVLGRGQLPRIPDTPAELFELST